MRARPTSLSRARAHPPPPPMRSHEDARRSEGAGVGRRGPRTVTFDVLLAVCTLGVQCGRVRQALRQFWASGTCGGPSSEEVRLGVEQGKLKIGPRVRRRRLPKSGRNRSRREALDERAVSVLEERMGPLGGTGRDVSRGFGPGELGKAGPARRDHPRARPHTGGHGRRPLVSPESCLAGPAVPGGTVIRAALPP